MVENQKQYDLNMYPNQEGGDICIHVADSLSCTAETIQHCKAITLQFKK